MRKISTVLILLVSVCLLLCSCNSDVQEITTAETGIGVNEQDVEQNILKLPYSANDSLNPFYAESEVNSQLASVLYEGLYKLDSSYNEIPVLASEGKVKGNEIIVTLKKTSFSDSSKVTADDVVYSFNTAKSSGVYSGMLAAATSDTVVFEMNGFNEYALRLLVFPVVKIGTADDKSSIPTGSGPFITSDGELLTKNPVNNGANIEKIQLVDISKSISEAYALQTGDISFCFDTLQSGSFNKINAVTRSVLLNNMVYIGFNSGTKVLSNPLVRQAIACAVDNEQVVQNTFRGNAVATRIPFNPNWSKTKDINITLNSALAVSYLEKAGFNKEGYAGILSDGEDILALDLVVNKDNAFRNDIAQIVKESLEDLGMKITIVSEGYNSYKDDIESGNFDLYIGEIKLGGDMGLFPFFFSGGSVSAGIDSNGESALCYNELLAGNTTAEAFCDVFIKDVPFAVLCFRTGVAASLRGVNLNVDTPMWYSSIEDWSYTK